MKEQEPEPEDETETEQAPKNDAYYYSKDKTPEPVAEQRNRLMHEKQDFSSHQPEQEQDEDIEFIMPKRD